MITIESHLRPEDRKPGDFNVGNILAGTLLQRRDLFAEAMRQHGFSVSVSSEVGIHSAVCENDSVRILYIGDHRGERIIEARIPSANGNCTSGQLYGC